VTNKKMAAAMPRNVRKENTVERFLITVILLTVR
jgi:hypothetical protein